MAFLISGVIEALYSGLAMNTPWCADISCLSLNALQRRPGLFGEIGVVDRQRVIGERDAGDFGVRQRQFLGGERGEPPLYDFARSEPGITRIFGDGHGGPDDRDRQMTKDMISGTSRPLSSVFCRQSRR